MRAPSTRSVISTHNLLWLRRLSSLEEGRAPSADIPRGQICETGQPENHWLATMSNDSTPIESTDSEWRIVAGRNAFSASAGILLREPASEFRTVVIRAVVCRTSKQFQEAGGMVD